MCLGMYTRKYFLFHLLIYYGVWIPAKTKVSDACHGALRDQTTNVLSCMDNLNICLTDVFFYQWHINDHSCPHTINKAVFPRCCRHDPGRCFWATPFDDVRELQRNCDTQASRQGGRCELHSAKPRVIQPLCTIDNIVLSTTSSVRSIHYICVTGKCPKLTTLLSGPVGYDNSPTGRRKTTTTKRTPSTGTRFTKNTGSPVVTRKHKYPTSKNSIAPKTTGSSSVTRDIGKGDKEETKRKRLEREAHWIKTLQTLYPLGFNLEPVNKNGSRGNKTSTNSGLSPLAPDEATTLATARIVAIDHPKDSGVGAIIGGIFGGIIICLILLGVFLMRRWLKRKIQVPTQSNTVVPCAEHPYEEMGPIYVNSSISGSLNSSGSFSSFESGPSLHHYSAIDSFRRTSSTNFRYSGHNIVSPNNVFLGGTENFLRRTSAKSSAELSVVTNKPETAIANFSTVPKRSEATASGQNTMCGGAIQTVISTPHQYEHVLTNPRSSHAGKKIKNSGSVSRPLSVVGGAYDRLERDHQNIADESSTDSGKDNQYNTLKPKWKR